MGSGTSRGKRVAPACVGEVSASASDAAAPPRDLRPFEPLKIRAIVRDPQPDCHSEGHDSDFSRDGDDVDGDLDAPLARYEERGEAAGTRHRQKKNVVRSRTYGLCHLSREEDEDPGPQETRGSRVEVKRGNGAFKHKSASPSRHSSSSQGFLSRRTLLEAVPTADTQQAFGKCHNSHVTMPVILYDGSEEELMDTIEREFS